VRLDVVLDSKRRRLRLLKCSPKFIQEPLPCASFPNLGKHWQVESGRDSIRLAAARKHGYHLGRLWHDNIINNADIDSYVRYFTTNADCYDGQRGSFLVVTS